MKKQNSYEVIIVGGSYSGLAAGMALGRALRNVLIIDSGNPCNKQTPYSHNFLTNDGRTPAEITHLAKEQVLRYSTVEFLNARVSAATKTETGFELKTETGASFSARKVIFATGVKDTMPDIPGFSECWGISILHCPYCHGYEVRGQNTGILANGDTALEFSALISNWTDTLTLYTNGPATLSEDQLIKLTAHKISIIEKEVARIEHQSGHIEHIVFKDGTKAPLKALYARLPFVQHSSVPESMGCEISAEGYLLTDAAQRTSVPGVFACGDNTTRLRTVANAVSMGTTTGMMVNKALIEEDF
ncbi:MAG: NAD(P)/FAD-dependent oxidoreductase [Saprospiraceae bacterium]|nr:NAD(P)/FAD-dependent oxidoreductase [Saprospiraceae bacterium]